MPKTKRNYKDGIFRSLFNNEDAILELYNALSGNNYPKGTPIEIVTLENAVFDGIKNDLAFIIDERFIIMAEQQSTMSPNFPLRMLCYTAREYENLFYSKDIYGSDFIKIPTPELYVFYNGTEDQPLESEMKLSDAFLEKRDIISLEAIVKVINVNYEKGAQIVEKCKTLYEYSLFIHKVRTYFLETHNRDFAITESIRECIENNILASYLKKNKGDIMSVLEVILTEEEREAIRNRDAMKRAMEKVMPLAMEKAMPLAMEKATAEIFANFAKQMKQANEPIEKIIQYTGLTKAEIEEL